MRRFTADFETTTDPADCRVWAYGICSVTDPDYFEYGNNIDDFMKRCKTLFSGSTMYFHNAKFDFQFIISWLLKNGFEHIEDKKERQNNTFTTLITSTGQFYSLEIWFEVDRKNKRTKHIKFLDSHKILNFSVEKIAKDFNLPCQKLELDYTSKREIGHELNSHEMNYLRNDVEIMARALQFIFGMGLDKMTIASDALNNFKEGCDKFRGCFPVVDEETDMKVRHSYKGGFTYLNPLYKEQETGSGIVFDKNSMYPAKMVQEILPIGWPEEFDDKYQYDEFYPLYTQTLTCSFELKPGKIPTIQLKNLPYFQGNEYLESSGDELVTLTLAKPDYELFMENYDVNIMSFDGGYKFQGYKGIFDDYINHWTEQKIKAKREGNGSLYSVSKLMLNSLYGRFGLNPIAGKKIPYLDESGVVKYTTLPPEHRDSIYVAVASFITAYARADIIRSSQAIRDYSLKKYGFDAYVYSDTDSIHCLLSRDDLPELSKFMQIDDYELGAWKLESEFSRGKYLRQKCYIEADFDGKITSTIAGLPKHLSPLINFDNFRVGFSTADLPADQVQKLGNKLTYKYVDGGVILVDTDFQIK